MPRCLGGGKEGLHHNGRSSRVYSEVAERIEGDKGRKIGRLKGETEEEHNAAELHLLEVS